MLENNDEKKLEYYIDTYNKLYDKKLTIKEL